MSSAIQQQRRAIFTAARRVSPLDRIAARFVDCVVAAALFSLGNALSYSLGVFLCLVFFLIQDGWGQSIGKRLWGLRVLQEKSESPAFLRQSALRNFPFALGVLFGAVPAFWVFFILISLPLFVMETYFVLRIESGIRLGDVLADTYVCDRLRRPTF